MATGWTWDYIRHNMTFPRYQKLSAYWRRYPPVHIVAASVAQLLGYRPPEESQEPEISESLEDLMRDFTAAGGMISG